MSKKETFPSESEWQIMEVLWESGVPLTSSEIIRRLSDHADMTPRTVRVLMNRLCQKRLLSYVVDKHDARVYIYTPLKSREECLEEKSRRFAESYFSGSHANVAAALLKHVPLTEEQAAELHSILEACRFSENSRTGKGRGQDK